MLSVALCTYNGEDHLAEQVQSILAQSLQVNELVICDDCSTDNSVEIIKKFIQKFPLIVKLYENEISLGPIKNFEKAIGLTHGDIIFLSDQDDVWKPKKVDAIVQKFNLEPKLEMIFTNGDLIDDSGSLTGKTLFETYGFNEKSQESWLGKKAVIELIYKRNRITGATVAFKRTIFEKSYPFNISSSYWHDSWIGMHAAANGTLGWINAPLIDYRIHPKQQVGIGNGVTLSRGKDDNNLTKRLLGAKQHFEEILTIVMLLSDKGYQFQSNAIKDDAVQNLLFINSRSTLPKNMISRIFRVLRNRTLYRTYTHLPMRSMLRDIINPSIQ